MKTKACQHRRHAVVRHFAFKFREAEEGRPPVWGVIEVHACVKCHEELFGGWAHGVNGKTERAVLKRYGVADADLPAPPNHKAKPPVEVSLRTWPFPVSSRAAVPPMTESIA